VSEVPPIVLDADGIGKSFRGRIILKSAGFAVQSGRITALMGRNGVGKTTLLRIVCGTLRADYGTVRFKSQYVARPNLPRMARRGLMFSTQDSVLTPHFTAGSHFRAFVQAYGGADRLEEIVSELRLIELLDRRPSDLSGGERQRVSLALAILREPDCLVMDEPFAGVAPVDTPLITAALLRLRDQGTGLAISGHDVRDIFNVSDEIVWMVGGTTHWLGSPSAAREHFQFRREYLGPRGDLFTPAE
jgi:ABC-type multidrug transport system ATPase subunit